MKVRGLPGGEYFYRPFEKYGFRLFEWGLVKLWTYTGDSPESGWGHPLIFPNMQRALEGAEAMHWRVPIDDTHTVIFVCLFSPAGARRTDPHADQPTVRYFGPMRQADGEYELTSFASQDHMAWETEGAIFDRCAEQLGASDGGIAMFRELLVQQIETVQAGDDPIGLVRDPEQNQIVRVIVREEGLPPDADTVSWVHPEMTAPRTPAGV
jgi:5,5'-dehydrodivanillate O-demethylase